MGVFPGRSLNSLQLQAMRKMDSLDTFTPAKVCSFSWGLHLMVGSGAQGGHRKTREKFLECGV
jgi:hypothetical protein